MANFLSAATLAKAGISPAQLLHGLGTPAQVELVLHGMQMHHALSHQFGTGTGHAHKAGGECGSFGSSSFQTVHAYPGGAAASKYGDSSSWNPILCGGWGEGSGLTNITRAQEVGISFHHMVVEPTDEQVTNWRDVFAYRSNPDAEPYESFLMARDQLKRSLGIKSDTEFDALIKKVLIQIAQVQRVVRGRDVPGFTLPLQTKHDGLLVTDTENASAIATLYIAPNQLAAATEGQVSRGASAYRLRSQLVTKVVEILSAGAALVRELEKIERSLFPKDKGAVKGLAAQIHSFRELVTDSIAASSAHKYKSDAATRAAVMVYASEILDMEIPHGQPGYGDIDLRFKIGELQSAMSNAYRMAAKRAERKTASGSAVGDDVVEEKTPSSAPPAISARRATRPPRRRTDRSAPRFSYEPGVLTRRDYERIVGGYYGTTVPQRVFIDGVLRSGDDEIDRIFINTFWGSAVSAMSRGEPSRKRVEMVGEDGNAVPLPPELEALFKKS